MASPPEEHLPNIPVSTMGLLRNETFVDIVCLVGPEKFPVKCHQLYLKAASPVFATMLAERWQKQVNQSQSENMAGSSSSTTETQQSNSDELPSSKRQKLTIEADVLEIQLTDVDPKTFQTFLLCIYEQADVSQHLKKKVLSLTELINLLYFAHRFMVNLVCDECVNILRKRIKIDSVIEIHQVASLLELNILKVKTAAYILKHFSIIMVDASFSLVDKAFLLEFLPKDELNVNELELFQAILGWTASQCDQKNRKITKTARRQVLGDALFLIRFPTMTSAEFAQATCGSQILTSEETLDIFKIICLKNVDKQNIRTQFCTKKRIDYQPKGLTVHLFHGPKVSPPPSIFCDGSPFVNHFKVSQKIAVLAVGFLGSVNQDSEYDVTLLLTGFNPKKTYLEVSKRVKAKLGEIFYFHLDKPVVLGATDMTENWKGKYYGMKFMLKGPNASSPISAFSEECYSVSEGGVDFYLSRTRSPLASFIFKKL